MTGAAVNTQKKTGRGPLLLIFLIPTIAMGMAWMMFFTGLWIPEGRTNKGKLILPPVLFSELQLMEGQQPLSLEKLEGNWGVMMFGSASCSQEACQDSLYKTRQVHVALGKEAGRVIRLYVSTEPSVVTGIMNEEHPNIFWLNSSEETILKAMGLKKWPANQYFIIDPLGNIIMGYQADQIGGDLLKDLKKLLKASNIG